MTDIDVDYFIILIKERPVLWDKSLPEYKDKFTKTEAWKSVCQCLFPQFEEFDTGAKTKLVNDIIKKWRGYKDSFMKYEKKMKELASSGPGGTKIKQYHLYNQLIFLKKNDEQEGNFEDDEPNTFKTERQENQRTVSSHFHHTARKRRLDESEDSLLRVLREPENRHMSFFKGILPSVVQLNEHQTLIFQSRVLQILTELHQTAWYRNHQTTEQTSFEIAFTDNIRASTSPKSKYETALPTIRNTSQIPEYSLESETNEDSLTNMSSETVDVKKIKVSFSDSENELTN